MNLIVPAVPAMTSRLPSPSRSATLGLPRTAMTSGKSTDSDWSGVTRETS